MYEAFYGFREKPFALSPDPEFLYLSPKHRRALTMLEYGLVNHVGFSVITGEIGSGKTTLLRKLLQQIEGDITVGLVSNTQVASFEELLRWVLFAFSLEYRGKEKVELYEVFTDFLLAEYARGRRTVLIIDEAQHLGPDSLEQLRMLSNINADKDNLLQLTLVGQPELWKLLRRPELAQFTQRIGVDYHLQSLDKDETTEYIRHRIEVAGGHPEVFQEQACEEVFNWTSGVPRPINLLCDMALVYGFADQAKVITKELVQDVAKDRASGLAPLKEKKKKNAKPGDSSGRGVPIDLKILDGEGGTAIERWYMNQGKE